MKKYKKYITRIAFLPLSFVSFCLFAQTEKSLVKGGGYLHSYRFSKYTGFTVSGEIEKVFRNNKSFTHGTRIDYQRIPPYIFKSNSNSTTFFAGTENLIVGYNVKWYPFSRKAYDGVFIGLHPSYFVKVNTRYKYGPALGSMVGFQKILRNRYSASIESSMFYLQNVNDRIFSNGSGNRYFYFFINLKAGIKL